MQIQPFKLERCDEVYRELEHGPEYVISAFADAYENGVSISVLSKAYGLGGLRIGWAATQNKEILEKMAVLKKYTTICRFWEKKHAGGAGCI